MRAPAQTFLVLSAFVAVAQGERFGDRFCKDNLCVSAVYDDQALTVKYTAAYSGEIGWVGFGQGAHMAGANMMVSLVRSEQETERSFPHLRALASVTGRLADFRWAGRSVSTDQLIAWGADEREPADPTVAVFSWTFPVEASFASARTPHIWALSSISPHSNDPNARLRPHDHRKGIITLDFTKPVSGVHPTSHNASSKIPDADGPAKSLAANTSIEDVAPTKSAEIPRPGPANLSNVDPKSIHPAAERDLSDHSVRRILVGRFRVFLPDRWINIHRTLQTSALILILFGFACAFEAVHSMRFAHFVGTHGKLGLVMIILVMIQASMGQLSIFLFRSKGTRLVNYGHLLLGIVLFFVLSLWQIRSGFHAWAWKAPSWIPDIFFPVWFSIIAVLFFGGLALLPQERRSVIARRKPEQPDLGSQSWHDDRLQM
ncbi:hypothetical protein OC861_002101 [Tilletia horrida]|nr:hypothetical protein OC861_002101 [Tilletia horrida]